MREGALYRPRGAVDPPLAGAVPDKWGSAGGDHVG